MTRLGGWPAGRRPWRGRRRPGRLLLEPVQGRDHVGFDEAGRADVESAPVRVVADHQVGAGRPPEVGASGRGHRASAAVVDRQYGHHPGGGRPLGGPGQQTFSTAPARSAGTQTLPVSLSVSGSSSRPRRQASPGDGDPGLARPVGWGRNQIAVAPRSAARGRPRPEGRCSPGPGCRARPRRRCGGGGAGVAAKGCPRGPVRTVPVTTGEVAAGGGGMGRTHMMVSEGGLEPPRPIKGTSASS